MSDRKSAPTTPDGRYIVVRGKLWRASNPGLADAERKALVASLMDARRILRKSSAASDREREAAHDTVDRVKHALGERGPVWWTDGAPDYNRSSVDKTPYRTWYRSLDPNLDLLG